MGEIFTPTKSGQFKIANVIINYLLFFSIFVVKMGMTILLLLLVHSTKKCDNNQKYARYNFKIIKLAFQFHSYNTVSAIFTPK